MAPNRSARRSRRGLAVCLVAAAGLLAAAPAADAAWQLERTWKIPGVAEADVAPSGDVVTRRGNEVRHYASDGRQLHAWTFPSAPLATPGIALDGAQVVIVDSDIDLSDSTIVTQLTTYGLDGKPVAAIRPFAPDPNRTLGDPQAASMDVDGAGDRYLSIGTAGVPTIQRFDRAGRPLAGWGSTGAGPGQFGTFAARIASDGKGHVFAVDPGNNRVEAFNADGTFVRAWGQAGTGPGAFTLPRAIATDAKGDVWIADDVTPRRVQHFRASGRFVEQVPVPELPGPTNAGLPVAGLGFDRAGRLYVASSREQGDGNLYVLAQGAELASKALRYRGGAIAVTVRCPGSSACSGTLRVKRGTTTLGTRGYRVRAGRSATVSVRPGARGRRSLARSRKHRVAVVLAPKAGKSTSTKLTLRR